VPVQNTDWVSPTLGDSLGLPGDKVDRLAAAFNTDLRCPSNKETYDEQYPSNSTFPASEVRELSYASYAAVLGFHVLGDDVQPGQHRVRLDPGQNDAGSWIEDDPAYVPSLNRIGGASTKTYLIEGVRYVNSAGKITFNAFNYQDDGGNFMLYGPATPLNGDPLWWTADDRRAVAFRHNKQTMNVAMFDGHVESHADDSDDVLDIDRYFPSGFTVKNPRRDPNASAGDMIR
jgi:prepilin-type processing-associated H-X9-DG protein